MILAIKDLILLIGCFNIVYLKDTSSEDKDSESRVYLTPFIESGEFEEVRNLSIAGRLPNAPKVLSYTAFVTINKTYTSNLFFWFFPAMNKDAKAPFILWLQGGPGTHCFLGLFYENGPYIVDANLTAKIRPYHWAKTFQLLYVDNPVGAGYSYTENDKGYPRTVREVAEGLFEFLQQFFTVFHEYQKNDFYITGESYAGKYIPALAHKIHEMKKTSKMNLKGMAIGNGFFHPPSFVDYSEYLFNIGLVDKQQAASMKKITKNIIKHIHNEEWYESAEDIDKLVYKLNYFPHVSLFVNYTGMNNLYNYKLQEEPEDMKYYTNYTKFPEFAKALHLGNIESNNGTKCQGFLIGDIAQSVKHLMPILMDNYRVMIYSGQLDVIVPYPSTIKFLRSIKWENAGKYKKAKRLIWRLNSGYIAGYVHQVGDFYEVLVRNAGHLVPADQPEVAYELITKFIKKRKFLQ